MAPLKVTVISTSSQDKKNRIEGLLDPTSLKKWWCNIDDTDKDLIVDLSLQTASRIEHVNIGNSGSALAEISVGRSTWLPNRSFEILLPAVSLMLPADCKSWVNTSKVVLLGKASFRANIAEQKWDRVRVRCSQPFASGKQFGLAFLELRGADEDLETKTVTTLNDHDTFKGRCDDYKEIVEKAIFSSRKIFKPSLGVSRTEKCLERALSKSTTTGSKESYRSWSDSALLKAKKSFLKKFQHEVEEFLQVVSHEKADFSHLPDLIKNMEQRYGATLNKAERRVFGEVVGRKLSDARAEKNHLGTNRPGIPSSEPSKPGSGSRWKDQIKMRSGSTPVGSSNDYYGDDNCMRRRGTNVSRNILFYDDEVGEPANEEPKEELAEGEKAIGDKESNTMSQQPACSRCGKQMSFIALDIHQRFCAGKTDLDDDSQGGSSNNSATGKKDEAFSKMADVLNVAVAASSPIVSPPLSFGLNSSNKPNSHPAVAQRSKGKNHAVVSTLSHVYNVAGVAASVTAISTRGKSNSMPSQRGRKRPVTAMAASNGAMATAVTAAASTRGKPGFMSSQRGRKRPATAMAASNGAIAAAITAAASKREKPGFMSSQRGRKRPATAMAANINAMGAGLPAAITAAASTKRNPKSMSSQRGRKRPATAMAAKTTDMGAAVATALTATNINGIPRSMSSQKGRKPPATTKTNSTNARIKPAKKDDGQNVSAIAASPVATSVAAAISTRHRKGRGTAAVSQRCRKRHAITMDASNTATGMAATVPSRIYHNVTGTVPGTTFTNTVVPSTKTSDFAHPIASSRTIATTLTQSTHSSGSQAPLQSSISRVPQPEANRSIDLTWLHPGDFSGRKAQCPICLGHYSADYIQIHANQCLDSGP